MQKVINGHEDETGICAVEETLDETHEEAPPTHPLDEALLEAAAFIGAFGANARHGGDLAAYSPTADCALLPHRDQFESDAQYVVIKLHEHAHWTQRATRVGSIAI